MTKYLISKSISCHILMAGNYYKHHHPGGMSAVIQYWEPYIENLQYYPTYKLSNLMVRMGYFLLAYIRMGTRMLFDKEIAVVHLHTAADGSFWRKVQLTRLAKCFHKKVILHVHASRFKDFYQNASEKKKTWIRNELKRVDMLIVLSESWRKWFEMIGVESPKIEVLHNITDYPVEKREIRVDDGKVHFLFMGEIGQRKGIFDILHGLGKFRDELKDKIILRIGGNRNEEKLLKIIKENHLDSFVKFEGWVGGDKKIELLNWADVFILPSFNEGLPISILEAMSYSHPIISTPVGGIPEVVISEQNGVLVTPGDKDEIVKAIRRYVDNQELIASEGQKSRKIVDDYLPEQVMSHLNRIYDDMILC